MQQAHKQFEETDLYKTLKPLEDGDEMTTGIRWMVLLALMISAFILEPLFGSSTTMELLSLAMLQASVVGALFVSSPPRNFRVLFLFVSLVWFASVVVATAVTPLHGLTSAGSAILIFAALGATFANLMRAKAGNVDNLLGAVFGYLLLSAAWAILYVQIERWQPGSFSYRAEAELWPEMLYFSFVTITTLGYGDTLPVTTLAQTAAGLEAVVGVLYVAVMVGSIVGTFQARN